MKLFTGTGCMPCKMVKDWLKDNNKTVEQVNANDNMEEATKAGIKRLPTLVLDDGRLIEGPEDIIEFFEGEE